MSQYTQPYKQSLKEHEEARLEKFAKMAQAWAAKKKKPLSDDEIVRLKKPVRIISN
jgi:type III secretory pathway component EscR